MQQLRGGSTATVIHHLRATLEFRKLSSLWEIHVFDDNSVRIRVDEEEVVAALPPRQRQQLRQQTDRGRKRKRRAAESGSGFAYLVGRGPADARAGGPRRAGRDRQPAVGVGRAQADRAVEARVHAAGAVGGVLHRGDAEDAEKRRAQEKLRSDGQARVRA